MVPQTGSISCLKFIVAPATFSKVTPSDIMRRPAVSKAI
jgi:hypothetical protein